MLEPQLLNLCSRAQEFQHTLELVLCNKRSHCNEKPLHHNESSPHLPQLEKSPSNNEDSAQPKIKKTDSLSQDYGSLSLLPYVSTIY